METRNLDELIGRTFDKVRANDEEVYFISEGYQVKMHHMQDCCEAVWLEEVIGDLEDLVDAEILSAEETWQCGDSEGGESETWTFYNIQSTKGHVTLRWCGQSNGYYSESVDITVN